MKIKDQINDEININTNKKPPDKNIFIHNQITNEFLDRNEYPLIANFPFYNIILENKANNDKEKLFIRNRSVQKLLKLANINESDIFNYILFYINEINFEAIGENENLYNINYNELSNLIDYLHISCDDNDIKVHKNSLKKIFELCGLIPAEKIRYMNFQSLKEKKQQEKNDKIIKKITSEDNISNIKDNNKEETNKKVKPKTTIKKRKKKTEKAVKILKDEDKNNILKDELKKNNEIKCNKILLSNNRFNCSNANYILDSDDDNYESNLLERSYNIYCSKKQYNLKKLINANNDTKDDTFLNTLDTINNENISMSISINENMSTKVVKPAKKKIIKIKKKTKIKKSNSKLYEISSTSSLTYLGSTTSLYYNNNDINLNGTELIYPFNGFTKNNTSFSIETLKKQNKKPDEEYCYYPFILRQTPELKNKSLYLVGSSPILGAWDPLRAIKMDEEERNGEIFFSKYLEINRKEIPFEYKYFYYKNNKIIWTGIPFQNHIAFVQYFDYLRSLKKSHISIMNINIRYLNKIDGINIWENRKNKLIELLLNKSSDIFFFQEITKPQSDFIDKYLSSIYEFVGDYRDSCKSSEKCSICVNKLKYTIIHSGQFWLSSTPYIPGSNDFGNFFPRICTWASFKQIEGITLLFMNVHLDHVNRNAHLPCVKVLLDEEEKLINKYNDIKFVFIGGCFYCEENDEEINYIKMKGFNEIKFENTYHGFTGNAKNHWDYMFWKEKSGEDIELKDAYVIKKEATINKYRNHYISDHFPVYAEFFLKNKI